MIARRPLIRYHGGKWRLAPWIIQHLPSHRCYVEPLNRDASMCNGKGSASKLKINSSVPNEFRSSEQLGEIAMPGRNLLSRACIRRSNLLGKL